MRFDTRTKGHIFFFCCFCYIEVSNWRERYKALYQNTRKGIRISAFFTLFYKKIGKTFGVFGKNIYLCSAKSPDGGIGRRAGLKHQWGNPCRFDPGSGYRTRLVIKWLLTLFLFKGGSKNYGFKFLAILMFSVSAAFRLFLCHFVKSHQSHSPLCSFFNLQKHTRKKNENQLDIISRTTLKGERKRQAMQ